MTDEEFNDMKYKQERQYREAMYGDCSMHSTQESKEKDKKLEKYWDDMPDATEYNGPF